jgi:hypothetical protein
VARARMVVAINSMASSRRFSWNIFIIGFLMVVKLQKKGTRGVVSAVMNGPRGFGYRWTISLTDILEMSSYFSTHYTLPLSLP